MTTDFAPPGVGFYGYGVSPSYGGLGAGGWGTPPAGYGDYPVPTGAIPGRGLAGLTWGWGGPGTTGFTESGYAFLQAAKTVGTRPEIQQALRGFLATPQGKAWEMGLTSGQAQTILMELAPSPQYPLGRFPGVLGSAEEIYGRDPYLTAGMPWLTQTARAGYGYTPTPARGATPGLLTRPDYRLAYLEAMPEFESPAMEAYYKTQAGPIWQEYLVEAKKRFKEKEVPYLTAIMGYAGTSPEGAAGFARRLATGPTEAELVKGFSGYLKGREARRGRPATEEYPWWEKWITRPPSYRGEYTARYQPKTRWLTY